MNRVQRNSLKNKHECQLKVRADIKELKDVGTPQRRAFDTLMRRLLSSGPEKGGRE